MPPGKNSFCPFGAQELLADKIGKNLAAEELRQSRVIDPGDLMEEAHIVHPALGHQEMEVRMHIDPVGVGDRLLSRLSSIRSPDWRIGHFARVVPGGYAESLYARRIVLHDKKLGEYYRKLMVIIRGRPWSFVRFREICKMNLGLYDNLIDKKLYRDPPR